MTRPYPALLLLLLLPTIAVACAGPASTERRDTAQPSQAVSAAIPTLAPSATQILREVEVGPDTAIKCIEELALTADSDPGAEAARDDDDASKVQALLLRGEAAWDQGDLELVIELMDEAVGLDDSVTEAFMLRGQAYVMLGESARAQEDFSEAIRQWTLLIDDDPTAENYFGRGMMRYFNMEFEAAIADLNTAIELGPRRTGFYVVRGNAYDDSGEFGKAIESYEQALQISNQQGRAVVLADRGKAYLRHGDDSLARADLEESLSLCVGLGPVLIRENGRLLGIIYFTLAEQFHATGELQSALDYYTWAVESNPNHGLAFGGRGAVFLRLGDSERSLADFDYSIELEPEYAITYFNRGLLLFDFGEYDSALADFARAVELDPTDYTNFQWRGQTYAALGEAENAIADIEMALQLEQSPGFREQMEPLVELIRSGSSVAAGHYLRGFRLRNSGFLHEAIEAFNSVIAIDPEYPYVYNERGLAYHHLGELELAIADYSEAVRQDPSDDLAWWNRGKAYLDIQEYESAVSDLAEAIAVNADNPGPYLLRGLALFQLARYDEALVDLDSYLDFDVVPDNATAFYLRGLSYANLNQPEPAVRDLEMALEIGLDESAAAQAREILETLRE